MDVPLPVNMTRTLCGRTAAWITSLTLYWIWLSAKYAATLSFFSFAARLSGNRMSTVEYSSVTAPYVMSPIASPYACMRS